MTDDSMPAALRFMLAARRCELQSLESLAVTCELVTLISQLVHALQKERGYSNMYLGNVQERLLTTLDRLSDESRHSEKQLRDCLEQLDLGGSTDKARLLNRIAFVLYSLDDLPRLRRRVREQRVTSSEAMTGFTRLIGGLLAVVFEAADTALDPELTRALVAMFNFMQGKELAGQERATGVAGFAAGYLDDAQHERMRHLLEGQQRCFDIFREYANASALAAWEDLLAGDMEAQLRSLRGVAQRTAENATVDADLGELWFDVCTRRIDAMKQVENLLARDLLQRCRQSIADAGADLDNHRALLKRLVGNAANTQPVLFNVQGTALDGPPQDGIGSQLNRSILDLVHEQTQRLQALGEELKDARSTLSERKRVDQAKNLLMKRYQLSEQAAHEQLLRTAMDSGKRLAEVADQVMTHLRKEAADPARS